MGSRFSDVSLTGQEILESVVNLSRAETPKTAQRGTSGAYAAGAPALRACPSSASCPKSRGVPPSCCSPSPGCSTSVCVLAYSWCWGRLQALLICCFCRTADFTTAPQKSSSWQSQGTAMQTPRQGRGV